VILPTYAERESNARRIAAVGAGEFIVPTPGAWGKKRIPVDELGRKIDKVLHDPAYTARARRISARMQAAGGAPAAARLIEATAA
jgi:UDP:flavonoid glycosyltransferase YjiC (YdhE family)